MTETVSGYLDARALQHRAHLQRRQRIAARAVAPAFDTATEPVPELIEPVPAPPPKPTGVRLINRYGGVAFLSDDKIRATNEAMRAALPISIATIQSKVAKARGLTRADLLGGNRKARFAFARHIAIYLSRQLTPFGLPEIGRRFGGKDHTSVLHAIRRIGRMLQEDSALAAEVEALRTALVSERAEP